MKIKYKILHIEDVATDAELASRELRKFFDFEHLVVDREDQYVAALESFNPDVILCDHSLPSFNSLEALKIIRQKKIAVPFILLTATMSEEFAVEVIKRGAEDYVLKDRLSRLPIAVSNALEKARLENEKMNSLELLERNERRFRGIIEYSTDGILLVTPEGVPFYVSPSLHHILGYTEDEMMVRNLFDVIHQDDIELISERMSTGLSNPGVPLPRTESRAQHKAGGFRWLEMTLTSMLHDTAVNGIVLNFRDITERKEAEKLLKESEARYRSFFENSMDGILITAPDGTILTANAAACDIYGMPETELCNVGVKKIMDTQDPRAEAFLTQRHNTGRARGEILQLRKDGSAFPAEMTSGVFSDAYGNEMACTIIRDVTERKKAEETLISTAKALKQALNDVRKVMDSSLDVICTIDHNGAFLTVSSAAEQIWGYRNEELCGNKYLNMVYPPDIAKTRRVAQQILDGVPVTVFENRYIHKSGKIVPMLWSARWDDTDKVMYCIAKDATEKKQLEKAFEYERQRFHDMFLHAPSCLGILRGADHRFEMVNDQYLELTGRENIIGKTIWEVFPEANDKGFLELLNDVYRTGRTISAKEKPVLLHVGGKEKLFYLNFMYQAYKNNENKTQGVFFFINDVTEQVLSEKKIKESEKQFRQIVETAQEGIWMLDEHNHTKFVNAKMCEILGYSQEDILGKHTSTFIHNANHSFGAGIKTNVDYYEDKLTRKDGRDVYVNMSTNPITDDKGQYKGALAMVTDVTEWKRLQEKIVRQKVQQQKEITKAALQAQERERNFLGSELHDNINQILTSIKLFLKHYIETPACSIDVIKTSLNHLSDAIEEIRRLSQNLVTHRFDTFSFEEIVNSVLKNLPIKGAIELHLKKLDESVLNENIKLTLFRIIQEQVNNISKYAKASTIRIVIHNDDTLVYLQIVDNGVGFDTKKKRNGIGLNSIYNRVESYNGTVSLESDHGQGCKLFVTIPLQQPMTAFDLNQE